MNQDHVFVLPRKDFLDGNGFVWEFPLAKVGWNDLPPNKKAGRVIRMYLDGTLSIQFDALEYTAEGVFPDEIRLLENIE